MNSSFLDSFVFSLFVFFSSFSSSFIQLIPIQTTPVHLILYFQPVVSAYLMSVFFSYATSTSLPHIFFIPNSFPLPLFPFLFLFSFFLLSLLPPLLTLCFINSLAFLVDLFVSLAVSLSPPPTFVNHCGAESPFALCFNAVTSLLFFPPPSSYHYLVLPV